MSTPRWKEGAAHAPIHEVCGAVVADMHGGDWRKYAAWLKRQDDIREATMRLCEDRAAAWDVLMEGAA